MEIDENGLHDWTINNKIKTQKVIEQELDCKLIRIDPGKEDFDRNV